MRRKQRPPHEHLPLQLATIIKEALSSSHEAAQATGTGQTTPMGGLLNRLEKTKAAIRAKGQHPFRVIKRQFGYVKVRYRGLFKNTAQLTTLMALANLWMARKQIYPPARG